MNTTNKSFLIPLLLLILIGITFPIHGARAIRSRPNYNPRLIRRVPPNLDDDYFNTGGTNKIISRKLNELNKNLQETEQNDLQETEQNDLQETEQNEVKFLFWVWFAAAIATCYVWFGFETSIKRFCWTKRVWGISFIIFLILSIIHKTMAWWSIFISLGLWLLFVSLHENAEKKEQKKE